MRRAQNLDAQGVGGRNQVRNVAAGSSEEALVFEARCGATDADAPTAIRASRSRRGQVPGLSDHKKSPSGRSRLTDSRTVTLEQEPKRKSVGNYEQRYQDRRNKICGSQFDPVPPRFRQDYP